jgi:hypothetical protein
MTIQLTEQRTDRRAADNKGFAIAGVPCFADTFVQGGSSVLRMKFSANNPRHRKPPKRYRTAVGIDNSSGFSKILPITSKSS